MDAVPSLTCSFVSKSAEADKALSLFTVDYQADGGVTKERDHGVVTSAM